MSKQTLEYLQHLLTLLVAGDKTYLKLIPDSVRGAGVRVANRKTHELAKPGAGRLS